MSIEKRIQNEAERQLPTDELKQRVMADIYALAEQSAESSTQDDKTRGTNTQSNSNANGASAPYYPNTTRVRTSEKARASKKRKRVWQSFGVCAASICLIVGMTLGIYYGSISGKGTGGGKGSGTTVVMSTTDLVAFSAASSFNILTAMDSSTASTAALSGDTSIDDSKITEVNRQLALIESFIGNNPIKTTEGVPSGEYAAYEHMMTVTTTDLTGNTIVYTLYYNETLGVEDDDDDDDDWDTEQEFTLDGIMVSNGIQYLMHGEKELEQGEYEISFKAWADATKTHITAVDYVLFEQEIETEHNESEEEYKYAIYSNGRCISSFSLEIEVENGEQEIKFRSSDSASGNYINYSRKTEHGQTYIRATIVENGTSTAFKVYSQSRNGIKGYRYVFSDGTEIWRALG